MWTFVATSALIFSSILKWKPASILVQTARLDQRLRLKIHVDDSSEDETANETTEPTPEERAFLFMRTMKARVPLSDKFLTEFFRGIRLGIDIQTISAQVNGLKRIQQTKFQTSVRLRRSSTIGKESSGKKHHRKKQPLAAVYKTILEQIVRPAQRMLDLIAKVVNFRREILVPFVWC